jgi:hypothetical protein
MRLKKIALGAGSLGLAAVLLLPMAIRATNARASNKGAGAALDLTGTWQLDPSKSDAPRGGMGRGGGGGGGMRGGGFGGGMGGGGRHGGGGHMRGGGGAPDAEGGAQGDRPAGDRMRPGLPRLLHISTVDTGLSLADSSGAVVQEIAFTALPASEPSVEHHAPRIPGVWKDGKLEAEREDSRGTKITETFSLEDKGATLVVKTKMAPSQGGGFEMKRVYHKAGA